MELRPVRFDYPLEVRRFKEDFEHWNTSDDAKLPVHPPVARAIASAIKKLREAGHILIEIPGAPSPDEAHDTTRALYSLDNSKVAPQHVAASGEPIVPSVATTPATLNFKPD
jgi:Asp-tRNA(Asn)/Glu-tRNA(Gln) amidotransferase A subunit family amidase